MTGRDGFDGDVPPEEDATTPPEVVMRRRQPPPSRPQDTIYQELMDPQSEVSWPMDDMGSEQPRRRPSSLPPFVVGILVGVALATVSIVTFMLFRNDPNETATPNTTPVVDTSTTTSTTTTTTVVLDTTSTSSTSLPAPDIPAVGDPIALSDLAMASTGLGSLRFGDDGSQVLGRLVATFGVPDEDSGTFISDGEAGTCTGDPVRIVRWGPLQVVVTTPDTAPTFAGYRLDVGFGGLDSTATELRTVSGVRASDTIETLESVYAGFALEYVADTNGDLFFELRNASGELLLYGPVTSQDPDGKISGIYAPDPCTA